MIDKIGISNYKSISNMDIDLGRINVFIGANGAGKSNILEAIAIGSAAVYNRLDTENLTLRGVRVSDPKLMRNAFSKESSSKPIEVSFTRKDEKFSYKLQNENDVYSKWKVIEGPSVPVTELLEYIKKEYKGSKADSVKVDQEIIQAFLKSKIPLSDLEKFLVYSPENNELKIFEDEVQVEPLGVSGEGLFRLLSSMPENDLVKLKKYLGFIDWFEDFQIPERVSSNEKKIKIRDRFIDEAIEFFDQRSTNEGFLFLLFYLTLFVSKQTPSFFAIDNIDNSLNPRLCKDLIRSLVTLSQENNKQVILTTHNPSILDGMNVKDFNQRLYVVYRNLSGFTKIKRIDSSNFDSEGGIRLSEAFIRGYIGGLNKSRF